MDLRRTALKFLDLPLRIKFVLSFLIVILFGGLVSLFLGTRLEHRTIIGLAQAKVRHDLASAWMVYNEKLSDIRDLVLLNAGRDSVQSALLADDRKTLLRIMSRVRSDFELDILTITDRSGRVVLRTSQPAIWGDDQSSDPLVSRALRRETVTATEIVRRSELLKEGPDLAARSYLEFIPTPMATDRIARGDLNHRVRIGFQDEIGQLALSFNQMTENLKLANENLI